MKIIENHRTELKEILNDKLEKEIVAFLNSKEGGILYIGIKDDGTVTGIHNVDKVQLQVTDRIKNNILPSTLGLFDVVQQEIDKHSIIKIIISSGTEKPYYIKSHGMSPSGCYIRIGSSAQQMTTTMIDDLYSKRTRNSLSRMISPRRDLSFEQLKIYYEENGLKLNDQFKMNLELLTEDNKYNYVAYLLSDDNGTSIKVAKYNGKNKVNLIQNEEYGYCSLIKATKNVLNKFEIENITRAKITSKERIEKKLVNHVALREAIINAIVHNDYSHGVPPLFEIFVDRIVITSYGGLIEGLSKENFFACCSMPRNRELMRVFKDIKLVEQLGSGMERILEYYNRSIFNFTDNFMKVTFMFDNGYVVENTKETMNLTLNESISGALNESINEAEKAIYSAIAADNTITREQLKLMTGFSDSKVYRSITSLKEKNYIKREGSKKSGKWTILHL